MFETEIFLRGVDLAMTSGRPYENNYDWETR